MSPFACMPPASTLKMCGLPWRCPTRCAVASSEDAEQVGAVKRRPRRIGFFNQFVDIDPTLGTERQADLVGLVSQHEAEELAKLDLIDRHLCLPVSRL
ncbi:hypothetical protein GGD61_002551 [Bradyrhizobium sp. SBR1B]|nr:hypothetical protein [Bradyrhizobium sp. SBR1B]